MKKIVCLFVCLFIGSANATEIIVNGGFETGDFSGWTATNNGLPELTPHTVSGAGGGFFSNTSPLSGSFDAFNGFDGNAGLTYDLFQDVTIASGVSAILTTNHRIQYDSLGITSALDRVFEISILDLSGLLLANLYSESITLNDAGFTDLGWNNLTFDLSSFAGTTVRINFHEFISEDFTGPANIEFDDISLQTSPTTVPEPTTFVLLGLGLAGIGFSRKKKTA